MKTYTLMGTLIHEFTEFEWEDMLAKISIEEYTQLGISEAIADNVRHFSVLVKPMDELLTDDRPNTPVMVDVWRWQARQKAKDMLEEQGWGVNSNVHQTAILALLSRVHGASVRRTVDSFSTLYVPVRGIGIMQCLVPNLLLDAFFAGLPEEEKEYETKLWETEDILEAVFLMDRRA